MIIIDICKVIKMQAEVSCIYLVNVKHRNVSLQTSSLLDCKIKISVDYTFWLNCCALNSRKVVSVFLFFFLNVIHCNEQYLSSF